MPGSVIQLPGTPNPIDPSTGYQFVIEPGETGWYHTDGLPYWIASFSIAEILASRIESGDGPLPATKKFHFATQWPEYETYPYPASSPIFDWNSKPLYAKEKEVNLKSLQTTEDIINIRFEETNNPNQENTINFIRSNAIIHNAAQFPIDKLYGLVASDLFVPVYGEAYFNDLDANHTWALQGYSYTANHELGHSLGLGHSFFVLKLPGTEDTRELTIMSYSARSEQPFGDYNKNPYVTFTEMDTAALQWLYGPSLKVRTGNDTYVLDASKPNWLWDGVGVDTIDASSLNAPLTISLQPGYWGYIGAQRGYGITAPGSVTVNYGSTFENITGSAFNDTFTGNAANNHLDGGAGIDTVVFTHARASYNLARQSNGTWTAQDTHALPATPQPVMTRMEDGKFGGPAAVPFDGNDGADTLIGVERLRFSDHSLALDLGAGQASEQAARVIGTAFGKTYLANKGLVGVGIKLMDDGVTTQQIAELIVQNGLMTSLAGGSDNASTLKFMFNNVVGRPATASEITELLPLVNQHGQAWLIEVAAALPLTATQIDLVGLSGTGLAFV